jgi:transcriptional regulator with XRE-family HTH domain
MVMHWTSESPDAFIRRVTFDFWTQFQKRLDALPLSQSDLSKIFGVSESAVSQTLNNSRNPTLKTLYQYAQAARLKFAIVPYDDPDPENGPVNSEIFTLCWERAGRPHTFGEVSKLPAINSVASTNESIVIPSRKGSYCIPRRAAAYSYENLVDDLNTSKNVDNLMLIYGSSNPANESTASTGERTKEDAA